MIPWWKASSELCTNGKIADAGPHGALLYLSILCLHAKHGSNGSLPASSCKLSRLRIAAGAFLGAMDDQVLQEALLKCQENDLLEVDDDGSIRIVGWGPEFMASCARCGQPNPEPSFGTCPACREQKRELRAESIRERNERRESRAGKGRMRAGRGQDGGRTGHVMELPSTCRGPADSTPDRTGQDGTGQDSEKASKQGSLSQYQNPDGSPYREPGRDPSAIVAGVAAAKAVRA